MLNNASQRAENNDRLGAEITRQKVWRTPLLPPLSKYREKTAIPILIKNRDDLKEFLDSLSDLSFRNQTKYENSEWALVRVTNIVFFINKLQGHPIGCGKVMPDYVKNNRGLYALVRNRQTGVAYEDNLCVFRCLSLHQDKDVGNKKL